ncbi:F-box only protein 5 [Phyllopteryx taeniolatus]|uniref:F-box only protein 5 n=1 Tax=Phyllopteryx taeniolatus TaxID=161469 RepID=UPI002AD571C7|nr:F-box only protein 5 [Phyllopteryx taeniolatus]
MKCPQYDAAKAKRNMERGSPEKPLGLRGKDSPIKDPLAFKPLAEKVSTVLFHNDTLGAARDKENRTLKAHERTFDEALNDSGYLSLYNSHIDEDDNHGQGKTKIPLPLLPPCVTPKRSNLCQAGTVLDCVVSLGASSTPVDHCWQKPPMFDLSSTPSEHHHNPNLPIIKFQQAVCQELAKSYSKNKRYDWSVITEVAKDHLLHQVIGGGMGCEFVDVFASLLSKNMRSILANILALLGDMDLISCKKVSRTWTKIVRENSAALRRCRQAEKTLQESLSSVKQKSCGLTRDVVASRVVMSCMQKVASPHPPSSSSSSLASGGVNRRTAAPTQKRNGKSHSQSSCFNEYMQAASNLKQDESLRRCRQCGSPAARSAEAQRATCTRASCNFVFCTLCQEAFHGSAPCRMACCHTRFPASGNAYSVLPGSALSKRNVRRL